MTHIQSSDSIVDTSTNAVDFAAVSFFSRAYVQRCNTPKVHNLITLGGQHQGSAQILLFNEILCCYLCFSSPRHWYWLGVFGVPHCSGHGFLCTQMRALLGMGAYLPVWI